MRHLKTLFLTVWVWHFAFALFAQTVTGFHKRFVGTINQNIPIVLQLSRTGEELSGYYYYTKVGTPLRLQGKMKNGQWKISEYAAQETNTGMFDGKLVDGKIVGKWQTAKGDKQYDFELKEDYTGGAMAFDMYSLEATERLFSKHETPNANLKQNVAFPSNFENKQVLEKIRKQILQYVAPPASQEKDLGKAMKEAVQAYFKQYKSDMENAKEEEALGDLAYQFSYTKETGISVVFNDAYVLSLLFTQYEFTGGAHGNPSAEYLVFDLKTGNLIKTEDIFSANANVKTKVENLINEQFRKDNQINAKTTLTEFGLSVDRIPISKNFFITKQGVGFFYNVYEIAPYAAGQIEVIIPFSKLKSLLKSNHPLKTLVK